MREPRVASPCAKESDEQPLAEALIYIVLLYYSESLRRDIDPCARTLDFLAVLNAS